MSGLVGQDATISGPLEYVALIQSKQRFLFKGAFSSARCRTDLFGGGQLVDAKRLLIEEQRIDTAALG